MPDTPIFHAMEEALRARTAVALATVIEGPRIGAKLLVQPGAGTLGTLGDSGLDRAVESDAAADLDSGAPATHTYAADGEEGSVVCVFVEPFVPPPLMVILGAVAFASALAAVAKVIGFRVVVCDARAAFATAQRFPVADEVVNTRPDAYLSSIGDMLGPKDALCVLTHDHKFDVPAIAVALRTRVGYIGVLGSRRTHERRRQLLSEAGVGEAGMLRLRAPIGLDIGSRTPGETAVAICAEIIAARSGRAGTPLRDTTGAIH